MLRAVGYCLLLTALAALWWATRVAKKNMCEEQLDALTPETTTSSSDEGGGAAAAQSGAMAEAAASLGAVARASATGESAAATNTSGDGGASAASTTTGAAFCRPTKARDGRVFASLEDEVRELAEEYRACGNKLFTNRHFDAALKAYTKAVEQCERLPDPAAVGSCHLYLSNRAQCHIKLENYGSAIADATRSVELQPDFSKGYYRRGCANVALQKYQLALKDFQLAYKYQQTHETALRIKECQREIRSQKFGEAIATSGPACVSDSIDLDLLKAVWQNQEWHGPRYRAEPAFLTELLEHLKTPGNVLHRVDAYQIVLDAMALFKELPSLVDIVIPEGAKFTICGDIHGQFYDLCNIFQLNGLPSESNPYLFNGDFVDRGSFSSECIFTLFSAKLIFPKYVHLARGNHETRNMNSLYGFQGEIRAKYTATLYDLFCECFRWLPLAHVINDRVFVVHGGLFSSDDISLDDIRKIDRNCEPPDDGVMVDLLWSDPQPTPGRSPSKRGVACCFGPDVTERFLKKNQLDLVVRSHEMKKLGYEEDHNGKLITVFSAPNYCDQMENDGAFIRLRNKGGNLEREFVTFSAVPHPNVPPMQYANPLCSLLQ